MDLTSVIVGIGLLAIFVVPVIILNAKKGKKDDENKAE